MPRNTRRSTRSRASLAEAKDEDDENEPKPKLKKSLKEKTKEAIKNVKPQANCKDDGVSSASLTEAEDEDDNKKPKPKLKKLIKRKPKEVIKDVKPQENRKNDDAPSAFFTESENNDDKNVPKPKLEKLERKPKEGIKDVKPQQNPNDDGSSSESDLETYLKPADQIDLSSSFFDIAKNTPENTFQAIEENIFAGINRLSESESDPEIENQTSTTTKINFQQLHDYTKKIEEAKSVVEKYESKKKAVTKRNRLKESNEASISELLAKGEAKLDPLQDLSKSIHSSDFESFSDSEKDWEEVESKEQKQSIVPKGGVQITVDLPGVQKRRIKLTSDEIRASIKRRLNRKRKEIQVYVHKVHLLCWIAHGNYVNSVLNNENLLGLGMSLLPSQHCYPPERTDLSYLESIVKWFSNTISVIDKIPSKQFSLKKLLVLQINRKQAYNKKMLVYIFICMLRALGIQCRLVLSFVLVPLRPPAEELHSLSTKDKDKTKVEPHKPSTSGKKSDSFRESLNQNLNNQKRQSSGTEKGINGKELSASKEIQDKPGKDDIKQNTKSRNKNSSGTKKNNDTTMVKNTKPQTAENDSKRRSTNAKKELSQNNNDVKEKNMKQPNLKNLKSKLKISGNSNTETSEVQIPQLDGVDDSDSEETTHNTKPDLKKLKLENKKSCPIKDHPKRLKKLPNYNDDSEDDFVPKVPRKISEPNKVNLKKLSKSPSSTKIDIRSDIIGIMKGRMATERAKAQTKLVKRKGNNASDYDSDYAPESTTKKHGDSDVSDDNRKNKVKVKRRIPAKPEDNKDATKKKTGVNIWVEVYLENEEKWISVDVNKGEVHCVKQLYSRATHPVTYIVAWNNNNTVKDITQRYCPNWNTVTRKLRIDKLWWETSFKPYIGQKTIRDKEEDEDLARLQLEQPLPTTINEYKDHPLYALKRHLLKFQAIYPPDSITLGFIRKEAVYSRDCVHTLHSRETWLKHAKVVKLGETPYKIVKARPKYDKLSGNVITDIPLEIFGKWQVEDYVPPTAKDGIVPRNAYGNVELFKPCMLPKGTVHLQLPGLNRIAKKMNIDCVAAVVGFDIHSGWTHPTFDGFVVCEEFSESLISAYYLDLEEQEKKYREKTEKRVYDNWKRLIKGLLIRERLKVKYDYGKPSQVDVKNKKRKTKSTKVVSKKRRICSDSE